MSKNVDIVQVGVMERKMIELQEERDGMADYRGKKRIERILHVLYNFFMIVFGVALVVISKKIENDLFPNHMVEGLDKIINKRNDVLAEVGMAFIVIFTLGLLYNIKKLFIKCPVCGDSHFVLVKNRFCPKKEKEVYTPWCKVPYYYNMFHRKLILNVVLFIICLVIFTMMICVFTWGFRIFDVMEVDEEYIVEHSLMDIEDIEGDNSSITGNVRYFIFPLTSERYFGKNWIFYGDELKNLRKTYLFDHYFYDNYLIAKEIENNNNSDCDIEKICLIIRQNGNTFSQKMVQYNYEDSEMVTDSIIYSQHHREIENERIKIFFACNSAKDMVLSIMNYKIAPDEVWYADVVMIIFLIKIASILLVILAEFGIYNYSRKKEEERG